MTMMPYRLNNTKLIHRPWWVVQWDLVGCPLCQTQQPTNQRSVYQPTITLFN